MRHYPIWNEVQACIYKTTKNWGARNRSRVDVKVGTSKSNSHHFVSHQTVRHEHEDGSQTFEFYVDGRLIKRMLVKDGESKILTA